MIEAWGRGIERIVEACRAANAPEPIMRCEPSGLWVEFDFPKILNEEGDRLRLGEKLGETRAAIIRAMLDNPTVSAAQLARLLSVSTAVDKHLRLRKGQGRIGTCQHG